MLYNKERLIALMDKFDLAGVVAATPENIYYLERPCFVEPERLSLRRLAGLCRLSA